MRFIKGTVNSNGNGINNEFKRRWIRLDTCLKRR